jgi:type IV pilus assembly protein PilV
MRRLIAKCASRTHGRATQSGFALVESLIAVLLVSLGLMGVGQLILVSLREAAGALARTQAVFLVRDMMDRIRANPDALDAYDCATYGGLPAERGCTPSGAPSAECSARDLAEDDLARWQALVRASLVLAPGMPTAANVSFVAAASASEPARYRVEISWQQPGSTAPLTLSGEVQLTRNPQA